MSVTLVVVDNIVIFQKDSFHMKMYLRFVLDQVLTQATDFSEHVVYWTATLKIPWILPLFIRIIFFLQFIINCILQFSEGEHSISITFVYSL